MVSNESLNSCKDINYELITFKIKKDGPFEFVLDSISNRITIIDILDGGIIFHHGGFKIGDQLRFVNGQELNGTLEDTVESLEKLMEDKTNVTFYLRQLTIGRSKLLANNITEPDEQITSL